MASKYVLGYGSAVYFVDVPDKWASEQQGLQKAMLFESVGKLLKFVNTTSGIFTGSIDRYWIGEIEDVPPVVVPERKVVRKIGA